MRFIDDLPSAFLSAFGALFPYLQGQYIFMKEHLVVKF